MEILSFRIAGGGMLPVIAKNAISPAISLRKINGLDGSIAIPKTSILSCGRFSFLLL